MGLIDDLIRQQAGRIDSLERRIEALELEKRADLRAAPPQRDFKREVLQAIERHWNSTKEPLQQRFVSQTFSRAASKTIGGMRGVLDALERENKIKILRTASGANLLFPVEGFASLTSDAVEGMTLAGLTDAQRARLKARQSAVLTGPTDVPSEAELEAADAEALEAFKRGQS